MTHQTDLHIKAACAIQNQIIMVYSKLSKHRIQKIAILLLLISAMLPGTPARQAASAAELTSTALFPTGDSAGAHFGHAVAITRDYAVAGAFKDGDRFDGAGAAYIYARIANEWQPQKKLTASDGAPHDFFGYAVDIDQETAIIGAFNHQYGKGAAYIHQSNAGNWIKTAKLLPTDLQHQDNFGYAVAISAGTAIVGAYRADQAGTDAGAAYIFEQSGENWVAVQKLIAPDAEAGDYFGRSVSISPPYAAIGALHHQNNGAVYIYQRSGESWHYLQKLTPLATTPAGSFFGFAIDMADGLVAVAAPGEGSTGGAYLFRLKNGLWQQETLLSPPNSMSGLLWGRSVSVSNGYVALAVDGSGAESRAGEIHLFRKTLGEWQCDKEIFSPQTATPSDRIGWSTAIYSESDGRFSLISGAPLDDDTGTDAGSAQLISESDAPMIAVYPENLAIAQQDLPINAPPVEPVPDPDPDPCSGGLVVPDEVADYWRNQPRIPRFTASAPFPAQVDWSVYDSPVKSQGYCGSCAVFAAAALVENLAIQAGLPPIARDLSEQTILACNDADINCMEGGWYWSVLDHIRRKGVPPESCYPYQGIDGNCQNACGNPSVLAKVYTVSGMSGLWGTDHSVDDLRSALQNGPLCVAMAVPQNATFKGNGYTGGVYNYRGDAFDFSQNAHAVLLVGYDDVTQSFKAKNSWGENWGEGGYFRIAYDDVTDDVKFGSYACRASGIYLEGEITTILVTNHGFSDLWISAITADRDWLSVTPASGIRVAPGESQTITVAVDWDQLGGLSSGHIFIDSNDPDSPRVTVSVTAEPTFTAAPSGPDSGDQNGFLTILPDHLLRCLGLPGS